MKAIARSLVVVLVALIAVPALAVSVTLTTAVQLLATTALIMGGTQHPLSFPTDSDDFVNAYFGQARNNYIIPGNDPDEPIDTYAVIYPAEFFPVFGSTTFENSVQAGRSNLGHCLGATNGSCDFNQRAGVNSPAAPPPAPGDDVHFIVFGYSQSAVVASLMKNDLINNPDTDPALDGTEFDLVSNPTRMNGGILARGFQGFTIPIIGIPFYGPTQNSCPTADPCSPEDTDDLVFPTTDVAAQYDVLGGDAPARLDVLAFANSIASYALLHGNMPNRTINGTDPTVILQDTYGDTTYYMVTAPRLPLLMLAEQVGIPGPVFAIPDALLRVYIEDKYRRDKSPGEHVQFQLVPFGNPIALVGNMLGAIPVGIDDTVAQATGDPDNRPLGTKNVYRPFGVGGPVYDEDGNRTTDNIGIPTGAGDYDTQTSLKSLGASEPGDAKLNRGLDPVELKNDETEQTETETTPEVTRPRPFQKFRESLNFDPTKRPSLIRPSGEGPLKRIVNALTGQRSKPSDEPETEKPADEPPKVDAAA